MSIKAVLWAFAQELETPTQKLVLIALAEAVAIGEVRRHYTPGLLQSDRATGRVGDGPPEQKSANRFARDDLLSIAHAYRD
jgi:hypothetical protein